MRAPTLLVTSDDGVASPGPPALAVLAARLGELGELGEAVAVREPGPYTVQLRASQPEPEPGTDAALLRQGWVTVTPLLGIGADGDAEAATFIERAVARAA